MKVWTQTIIMEMKTGKIIPRWRLSSEHLNATKFESFCGFVFGWFFFSLFFIPDIFILITKYIFHTIHDLFCFQSHPSIWPHTVTATSFEIKFRLLNKYCGSELFVTQWPASGTNREINTAIHQKLAIMNTNEKAHHYGSLRTSDPGFNCTGWQLNGNVVFIT